MRLQSAFEYLISYGWAVFIIAAVILALFEFGLFNPSAFYPVSIPGSCQVIRPQGPLSTQFISLSGTCNTGLPESVALMPCSWPNIYTCNPNYIKIHMNNTVNPLTMSVWFWEPPDTYVSGIGSVAYGGVLIQLNGSAPGLWVGQFGTTQLCTMNYVGTGVACSPSNIVPDRWNYATVTMSNTLIDLYLNGQLVASEPGSILYGDGGGYIGTNSACTCFYNIQNGVHVYFSNYNSGYEYNVQIYNTTLTGADISALYAEGMNGAPIDLNNLMGWWPLNGNVNDYSGNGYNGNNINVLSSGDWQSTYAGKPT